MPPAARVGPAPAIGVALSASVRVPCVRNAAFDVECRPSKPAPSPRHRPPAARAPSAASSREAVARALVEAASAVHVDGEALMRDAMTARDASEAAAFISGLKTPQRNFTLLWAAYDGRRDLCAALLATGADPRFLPDHQGCFSALHYASLGGHARLCELLLAAGSDPHDTREGYTPLDFAVLGRSAAATAVLAARGGASPPPVCRAALTLAAQTDASECVEVLLPLCDGEALEAAEGGYSPLHLVAEAGYSRSMRALLVGAGGFAWPLETRTHDVGDRPLHLAARGGFCACVALLLAKGADAGALNDAGQTPLHLAAQARCTACVKALLASPRCVPDARDADGRVPLHYLRTLQSTEVTRLLLERGVDASARDRFGYTPLHVAAHNDLSATARELLRAGADVTARTDAGVAALTVVARKMPAVLCVLRESLDAAVALCDSSSGVVTSTNAAGASDVSLTMAASLGDNASMVSSPEDTQVSLNFRPLLEHSSPGEISYLKAFVDEGQKDFLKHPLCQAFLHYKWRQIRKFYGVKILFYALFVASLTVYVISANATHYDIRRILYREKLNNSCDASQNSLCKKPTSFSVFIVSSHGIVSVSRGLFIALTVVELLRKVCGCAGYATFRDYANLDNMLEWVVSLSSVVLVSTTFENEYCVSANECFQDHIGATALLLSFFRLMRMVGHLPTLQCYVAMYMSVLRLFLRVLSAYLCLLLGFLCAFCAAFPGLAEFANPAMGFLRTIGVMAGELLLTNSFVDNVNGGLTVTSHLMLLIFVLFVTIVLMNLLVGLAVNDIQGLQARADLLQLQHQTRLISQTERALLGLRMPSWARRSLLRHASLSPGRYRKVFNVRPLWPRERRLPPQLLAAVYALARQPASGAVASRLAASPDDLPLGSSSGDGPVASAAAVEKLALEVAQLRKSLEVALQLLNGPATEC